MQQSIGRDRGELMKSAQRRNDGIGSPATPEQEDMPRRQVPCELERDHAAEGRAAEIEWLGDLNPARKPCSVGGQRLARAGRLDPGNRPYVANFALAIEQPFISTDPWKDEERPRHAGILPAMHIIKLITRNVYLESSPFQKRTVARGNLLHDPLRVAVEAR